MVRLLPDPHRPPHDGGLPDNPVLPDNSGYNEIGRVGGDGISGHRGTLPHALHGGERIDRLDQVGGAEVVCPPRVLREAVDELRIGCEARRVGLPGLDRVNGAREHIHHDRIGIKRDRRDQSFELGGRARLRMRCGG